MVLSDYIIAIVRQFAVTGLFLRCLNNIMNSLAVDTQNSFSHSIISYLYLFQGSITTTAFLKNIKLFIEWSLQFRCYKSCITNIYLFLNVNYGFLQFISLNPLPIHHYTRIYIISLRTSHHLCKLLKLKQHNSNHQNVANTRYNTNQIHSNEN